MKARNVLAYAQAAGAAVLWGTVGVAGALTRPAVSPFVLAWARLSLGGVLLAVLVGPRRLSRVAGTLGGSNVALAALFMAVFQGSFFVAAMDLGAGPATVISVAAAPATSLLGAWRNCQASSPARPVFGLALAIAVAGLSIASISVSGLCGAGWAIASGAAYAGFARAVALCDTHPRDGLAAVVIALLGGALAVTPVAAPQIAQICSLRNAFLGAYLGVVATALAYAWFAAALAVLGRTVALATLVGQPVAAALLAWRLFGEPVGWHTLAALAIAGLLSAWLAISGRPRPDPRHF